DESDAKRVLDVLHRRSWLNELGWHIVGERGQLLERSPYDRSVASPERLVFEGKPRLEAPLVQAGREARACGGAQSFDSRSMVPELTAAEEMEYRRLVGRDRLRLKPASEKAQAAWLKAEGAQLGPDGAKILRAALNDSALSGAWGLVFDEFGDATIDQVMADP